MLAASRPDAAPFPEDSKQPWTTCGRDVEPRTLAYHLVATTETLVGLGVLTLAITYILNLYRVLHEQGCWPPGCFTVRVARAIPISCWRRTSSAEKSSVFQSAREASVDGTGDLALRRFLEVETAMYELSGSEPGDASTDRYQRYREWTRFTGRARAFVDLASRDLGMDANLMYEDPSRVQR